MSDIFRKKDWIYLCKEPFSLSFHHKMQRERESDARLSVRKSFPYEKNKFKCYFFLQFWRAGWIQPRRSPQDQFHSLCSMGCKWEVEVAQFWQLIQERTIKVTVPFVRLRMATASSCVTPSRLCPLTAMIWSPLFRRPSSEAAPCNYKVACLLLKKMLPRSYTTEKDPNKNVNCSACTHTLLSALHRCSTAIKQWWTDTKEAFLLNGFSTEIPIWERI